MVIVSFVCMLVSTIVGYRNVSWRSTCVVQNVRTKSSLNIIRDFFGAYDSAHTFAHSMLTHLWIYRFIVATFAFLKIHTWHIHIFAHS